MNLTIGSMFTGTGALDMAVEAVTGARLRWVADIDPAACVLLAYRFPGVPNLGDVSRINWLAVPRIDILTGGFPCQDLSHAGHQEGMKKGKNRSGQWAAMVSAIAALRPTFVVIENVRGLLGAKTDCDVELCPTCLGDVDPERVVRALGVVLADLAELGYDARWCGLRAADVGAPHGRYRVFILAYPTSESRGVQDRDDVRARSGTDGCDQAAGRSAATDSGGSGRDRRPDRPVPGRPAGIGWGQPADGGLQGIADSDSSTRNAEGCVASGPAQGTGSETGRRARRDCSAPHADPDIEGHEGTESARRLELPAWGAGGRQAAADTSCLGRREGEPEPAGLVGRLDADPGRLPTATDSDRSTGEWWPAEQGRQSAGRTAADGDCRSHFEWGAYEPAIRRWEHVTGRPAPDPTTAAPRGGRRLNPAFVEWMMGLPAGWVTEVPVEDGQEDLLADVLGPDVRFAISHNDCLRLLGNGVVRQQAAVAVSHLLGGLAA